MVLSNATTDYLSRQPPTTNQLHNTTQLGLTCVLFQGILSILLVCLKMFSSCIYIITLLGNINCFLCLNI